MMNCPRCGSADIDVSYVDNTCKSCGMYYEEGIAVCNNCNNNFGFKRTYDLILNHIEYK